MNKQLVSSGLVSAPQFQHAADRAARTGATAGAELVMSGIVDASDYATFFAAINGLERLDTGQLVTRLRLDAMTDGYTIPRGDLGLGSNNRQRNSYVFTVPQCPRDNLGDDELSARSVVSTRQELGDAYRKILRGNLTGHACNFLNARTPQFSAARRLTWRQYFVFGLITTVLSLGAMLEPQAILRFFHFASPHFSRRLFCFGCFACFPCVDVLKTMHVCR
jgi:hypothetical protein